jgi:hypothetical protein
MAAVRFRLAAPAQLDRAWILRLALFLVLFGDGRFGVRRETASAEQCSQRDGEQKSHQIRIGITTAM